MSDSAVRMEHRVVVMGVAGCGKSSLGTVIASNQRLPLIEGDDFHSPANLRKMSAGIALTDADRSGWLRQLGAELARRPQGAVLTCSALKRSYRDQLRAAAPGLRFVFMDISRADALARVRQRAGAHLFPASLVGSQFEALERPDGEPDVLRVDATAPLAALGEQVSRWLRVGEAA